MIKYICELNHKWGFGINANTLNTVLNIYSINEGKKSFGTGEWIQMQRYTFEEIKQIMYN